MHVEWLNRMRGQTELLEFVPLYTSSKRSKDCVFTSKSPRELLALHLPSTHLLSRCKVDSSVHIASAWERLRVQVACRTSTTCTA
jgi:hypothetical protein